MNIIYRGVLLLILLGAAPGFAADGPGAGYKLHESGEVLTFVSPDKKLRVEQYAMVSPDGNWHWQFWVFDSAHKHGCLLNAEPMHDYAAGFRFSPDSQWLVRMQKTAADCATLFLYRRDGLKFAEATKKPLGDLAWAYYDSVRKELKLPGTNDDDHHTVDLIKGYEADYNWLGYKWPAGRNLVLGLFSDSLPHGFWCVYDTETGRFSMPPGLDAKRAAAEKEKSGKQGQ